VIRCTAYGYDDLPMAGHVSDLPVLQAGSSHSVAVSFQGTSVRRIVVDVMRPTGFSAITAEYLDKAAME
jgi:beta-glucuronidase